MRISATALLRLDATAWRRLLMLFVGLGGVGLLVMLAAPALGLNQEAGVRRWLDFAAHSPWALPAAIVVFTGLAFLGAPQFVLIAAAAAAFGPWRGFAYSWVGTLISAFLGFWLGRRFGARLLAETPGEKVRRFVALIGRNGFAASLIVRLVPSAPFIVVNMVAGLTPMRLIDFAAGTAIGIVPKIALTAFAGGALAQATRRTFGLNLLLAAVAVAAWAALGFATRVWLKRHEAREAQ